MWQALALILETAVRIKLILTLIISIFIPCSFALGQNADDILFMTEDYPPYNFREDGKLKGISVDLMVLMLQKLNSKLSRDDIELHPWAHGYHWIQKKPNTCLFAMTRTKEREKLFKWVGPFAPETIVLFALKRKKIIINSIEDLYKYKIGVVRDDIAELFLRQKGVSVDKIDRVAYPLQNARKLSAGRIDMWAYGEPVGLWIIKKNGLNSQNFEIVYQLGVAGDNYFAFHKETSDELIQRFQKAFDELKKEGRYKAILDNYLK